MKVGDLYQETLVCYDVKNNKARTRLADSLKDLGLSGIQESVFWGYVTLAERRAIHTLFTELLDPDTDRAFAIPVGIRKRIGEGCGFGYTIEKDFPVYHDFSTL
ncbi:MAG: CRISPR-associated endonuclease Cas2 [Kiritimatiellae bacterium]|nr:CRISPR-associated endonuclease Cas2 [Kiritimatiellia bacterium]